MSPSVQTFPSWDRRLARSSPRAPKLRFQQNLTTGEGATLGETVMQKLQFQTLLKIAMLASAAQIVVPAHAQQPLKNEQPQHMQLATGQFITPTAARGSVQQMLNPGLAKYPDFIASEAVRSQLSPDGKTLAVLTAGFNSLDDASGQTDAAN